MSAPIVWIAFPAVLAGLAFLLRRWYRAVVITISLVVLLLAGIAWLMPIGELINIGPFPFTLADRVVFAGRQFVLDNSDRPLLVLIYFGLTFFFVGSFFANASKMFVPMGLAMSSMLIASVAVEPFLYAALLIEVAVLLGVPLLSPPGKPVERAVLRYLTFLSFGLPFMLLSGWLLSDVGAEIDDPQLLLPAFVFLGFGFVFLLAIFPMNTWIPMLTERLHPYAALFVLILLPMIVITLLLRFVGRYPWLLSFDVIQLMGLLMVVTGGVWAAFQRDLGRLMGYAIIIEVGRSLLAVSQPDGLPLYVAMFVPRLLAFGLWALSLSLLRTQVDNLHFRSVQGLGRRFPLVALGVIVAHFSLAGFPILANFPTMLRLWQQLAQISSVTALWVLLGSVGLTAGGLRTLAVLVMGPEQISQDGEINRSAQALVLVGVLAIVIVGVFPQIFSSLFSDVVLSLGGSLP